MKTICSFLLLIFISTGVSAQLTVKDLVEKHWEGLSVQDAAFTQSGKVHLYSSLDMVLHDDNTVTGTSTTKMTLDGITYTNTWRISGTFNSDDWTVTIKDEYSIYSDALPGDLYWCAGHGTFTFYKNSEKEGHFLLSGTSYSTCTDGTYVEYSDQ
jgi:hypothetical protein